MGGNMRTLVLLGLVTGCTTLELDPPAPIIHARFDPDASVIPMPNDTVKERAKLNPTEVEFYDYLETLDGWSSLMSATVEFTGPIDAASITDGTVQVWHWGAVPERVTDARLSLSQDGMKLTIDPP